MRLSGFALLLASCALAGCSASFTAPSTSATQAAGFRGTVHGGQQPVSGSHIYLYAMGAGGLGSASTSLLNASANTAADSSGNNYVTTDANGFFSISGDYTCSSGQQVYLLASGGDAGAGANSAITMLAALGACPSNGGFNANFASTYPFVTINEVTTVAASYALAEFASDSTHIGYSTSTSGTNGAANAMLVAAQLADVSTGVARTATTNHAGVVPQTVINTVANVLAACVNSSGPSSTACSTLGNATAESAMAIARDPGSSSIPTDFNLIGTTPPFQPSLASAPTDLSVRIDYFTGGQLGTEILNRSVALDQDGNVWAVGTKLHRISPVGKLDTFSSATFTAPSNVVVQPGSSLVWVADAPSSGTRELWAFNGSGSNYGTVAFGPYTSACSANDCSLLQADSSFVWTPDTALNRVTAINVLGNPTHSNVSLSPSLLSIANDGAIFVSDGTNLLRSVPSSGTLSAFTQAYSAPSGAQFTALAPTAATETDTSSSTRALMNLADGTGGNLDVYLYGGAILSSQWEIVQISPLPQQTTAMVWDGGAGKLFSSSIWYPQLIYSSSFSSAASYTSLPSVTNNSIWYQVGAPAIDASGNVWMVENSGSAVAEYIGLAKPLHTPLAPGYFATTP